MERPTQTETSNQQTRSGNEGRRSNRSRTHFPARFSVTTNILIPHELTSQNNLNGLHQSNLTYTVRSIESSDLRSNNDFPDHSVLLNVRNSISSCYNPSDPLVLVESLLQDLENRMDEINNPNEEESIHNDVNNKDNQETMTDNHSTSNERSESEGNRSQNFLNERETNVLNRVAEMMRKVSELHTNRQVSTRKFLSIMNQLSVCSNICSSVLMTPSNRSAQSTVRIGIIGSIPTNLTNQDSERTNESSQTSESNRSTNTFTNPLQFLFNNANNQSSTSSSSTSTNPLQFLFSNQNQEQNTSQTSNAQNSNQQQNPLQFLFQNQSSQSSSQSNSTIFQGSNLSQILNNLSESSGTNQTRGGRSSLLGLLSQLQFPGLNLNSQNNRNSSETTSNNDTNEPSNTNDTSQINQMTTTDNSRETTSTEERHEDIRSVIARDVERQKHMSPQLPFSDAYLEGQNTKKRKIDVNDPDTLFCKFLRKSVEKTKAKPSVDSGETDQNNEEIIKLASCTTKNYIERLKKDVKDKLKDEEYQKIRDRFPQTKKKFE